MGAGAFVCGEETALMTSIEGNRGEPRPRPPFPAIKGLWGKPSVLNNVETFANIAPIILKGAEWFASIGTEKSKGTKVFALAGNVNNTGLVEVPMGTPLGEIIYDIGGGIPGGKKFKAAQIGGPSGGCIPREHLERAGRLRDRSPSSAPSWAPAASSSWTRTRCMVDLARFFLDFIQDESCGKCPPCRVGTKRMLEILNRICDGKGEEGDIERLDGPRREDQGHRACGLGQTAPNPVLSTIRHFRHEYDAHIRDKHCQAGVCAALFARAVPERLPGRRRRAGLRLAGRREALRRGPAPAPRAQPVRLDLRPRLLPPLREQVPARDPRRAASPSAASSAS